MRDKKQTNKLISESDLELWAVRPVTASVKRMQHPPTLLVNSIVGEQRCRSKPVLVNNIGQQHCRCQQYCWPTLLLVNTIVDQHHCWSTPLLANPNVGQHYCCINQMSSNAIFLVLLLPVLSFHCLYNS